MTSKPTLPGIAAIRLARGESADPKGDTLRGQIVACGKERQVEIREFLFHRTDVVKELRQSDGPEPCYWLTLKYSRLVIKLGSEPLDLKPDDEIQIALWKK